MDEKKFSTKISSTEKDVIDFYDAYAESWDERFGDGLSNAHFHKKRFDSFKEALLCAQNNDVAVELGVGTGVYIDKVACLCNKIIGIDGSKNMLEVLDRKLNKLGLKNVSLYQSNVLDLVEISDSSIDVVYFFGLIEHIVDISKFINEIKRVLKPGGIVIGVTPNGSSPWYSLRYLFRGTGKHCSSDTYYTKKQIDDLYTDHDFAFEKILFWGGVPAGINNFIMYKSLALVESIIAKTLFKKYFGGMTFVYKKKSL